MGTLGRVAREKFSKNKMDKIDGHRKQRLLRNRKYRNRGDTALRSLSLPPGEMSWGTGNMQMRGYKLGFSDFGTVGDRVVGDDEFFRGKIRNWRPNPKYGTDKMRISKDELMKWSACL